MQNLSISSTLSIYSVYILVYFDDMPFVILCAFFSAVQLLVYYNIIRKRRRIEVQITILQDSHMLYTVIGSLTVIIILEFLLRLKWLDN